MARVPFAKPPIGSLRWRAPEDLEPWEGVRTAKERAPECIQPKLAPPLTILPEATGSEDCLYLNIYRPQTREENLPVYVFLHGGGNVFGGAQGWYIQELARKANLVLVEVQYRLGPFGYFTHPIFRSGRPQRNTPATSAPSTRSRPCNGCGATSQLSVATRST